MIESKKDLPQRTARLRAGVPDLLLLAAGSAAFLSFFNLALRRYAATREPVAITWPAAGTFAAVLLMGWAFSRILRRGDHWTLFLGAAVAFCCFAWLRPAGLAQWALPIALLPLVPCVLLIRALLQMLRRTDELARRVISEALALSFICTFLGALLYAVLEAAGFPPLRAQWVCVFLVISFSLGIAVFSRRYE